MLTMLHCFNVMLLAYSLSLLCSGCSWFQATQQLSLGPDPGHPQADDTLLLEQRNLLDLINKLEGGLGQVEGHLSS